ncbi:MAG: hypothetical protein LBV46_00235 [Bacteroidales bacterium]|nr:hypothetical protein [Bacteroidales bacterium]
MKKEDEFCNIITPQKIDKKGLYYFDFSAAQYNLPKQNAPKLIIELRNPETNQPIKWQEIDIAEKQGRVHALFSIEDVDIPKQQGVVVNAYFWNKQKSYLDIFSTGCAFYQIR